MKSLLREKNEWSTLFVLAHGATLLVAIAVDHSKDKIQNLQNSRIVFGIESAQAKFERAKGKKEMSRFFGCNAKKLVFCEKQISQKRTGLCTPVFVVYTLIDPPTP